MKHLSSVVIWALVLLLTAPGTRAQDVENAVTPTDLPALMPEAGLGAGIDFWLIMTSPFDEGGGPGMYMHWSILPDGENTVFSMEDGSGGEFKHHSKTTIVFDAEGKLVSFSEVNDWGDGDGSVATGKVVGGKLVITRTTTFGDDADDDGFDLEPEAPEVEEIDLSNLDGAVPMPWMPLVFAYHIREGNLGYSAKMAEVEYAEGAGTMIVEDVGAEPVEFEGKEQPAHVLLVKIQPPEDADFERDTESFRMRVLKDGSIFSMTMEDEQMEMTARRASAEEVAKLFKPGAGDDAAE